MLTIISRLTAIKPWTECLVGKAGNMYIYVNIHISKGR